MSKMKPDEQFFLDFLTDFVTLSRKYKISRLAKALGVQRQALDARIRRVIAKREE